MNARGWLQLASLVVIGGGLALVIPRMEGTPPTLAIANPIVVGRDGVAIEIRLG